MGLVASSQTLVPFLKSNGKWTFVRYGSMEKIIGIKEYMIMSASSARVLQVLLKTKK